MFMQNNGDFQRHTNPETKTLRISGQHIDLGDAFRFHIEKTIQNLVTKYYNGDYDGHVTIVKSGSGYSADCLLHLSTGIILQTAEQGQDPRFVFDKAVERLEKRLKRYKQRRNSQRRKQPDYTFSSHFTHHIMEPTSKEDEEISEDYAPAIIAENVISLPFMSVAQAVLELELIDNPVLLFRNVRNEQLNIVYRRSDGNIGWVNPEKLKDSEQSIQN